jgi:tetratricopeptide (TPR) repeat protein
MKLRLPFFQLLILMVALAVIAGCASIAPRSDSYKLSDAFIAEVQDNEDPYVMEHFYNLNDYLAQSDWAEAVESATKGIDAIPKYRELFSYFYAMRAFSSIMLYRLEASVEDIENLTRYDKDSSMIPGLWTYYYFSYAPFDPDPKSYYRKAKESLAQWRAARPRNAFELIFSDPARIADVSAVIDEVLKK